MSCSSQNIAKRGSAQILAATAVSNQVGKIVASTGPKWVSIACSLLRKVVTLVMPSKLHAEPERLSWSLSSCWQ